MSGLLERIDKNFAAGEIDLSEISFHNVFDEKFALHGLYQPRANGRFVRLPPEFETNESVNEGVRLLLNHTAGGRVRFSTDSECVAICAVISDPDVHPHMASTCSCGFDMYARKHGSKNPPTYRATFMPHFESDGCTFSAIHHFEDDLSGMREITINFPLYSGVSELCIGLDNDAEIEFPMPYTHIKPVVFYGSSITQGGCASRPGCSYNAILSRMLDCDIINLGFSGSACGENELAKYIASIPMSAFVLDYDHNARTLEMFEDTHYPFYETVRKNNPDLPIVMISAPTAAPSRDLSRKQYKSSRLIVMESYIRAIKSGDGNVYFIDGEGIAGDVFSEDNFVDGCHPTDSGFRNMANRIYPVLKQVL